MVTELVLNETVEMMVPIAFLVSYSTAYYGPNKDILGDVGCDVWQFEKIEELNSFFMTVAKMAIFDSGSVILGGGLLWWFCRINIFRQYCRVMKKYWIHLAAAAGCFVCGVSI